MSKFAPIDHIMPFEPFHSSGQKGSFPVVTDDRRDFYSKLSGESISNEVTIAPSGAWPVMNAAIPQLTEALRLTLKRPEPVTLTFHPYDTTTQLERFRVAYQLFAHVSCPTVPVIQSLQGRIIVEWGSGKTREWTYFDLAGGSFHIPACTHVKVFGWTHTATVQLGVTAQIGYAHGPHDAYWTMMFCHNAVGGYTVNSPHYGREISANFVSTDVAASGYVQAQNAFSPATQYWLMRPAITPNPQDIPYAPVKVPLSGGFVVTLGIINPGAVPVLCTEIATVTVRI
jgi:hypothetical protein